ncbi:PhzF family phenazine biosynthesis protein [Botrimarina hoheduenensis]|uniref:Putative isomerase YddE n=1 Tax=Botrimarina hoheduenensis TaxID=2528000 RepID=A0A5C5VQ42_9BACT|nr:PhzF family phenazine biosynthesis protein [Botrimarina hoheduenensis]TWT40758.1 putative isomerase YddE [Botrimarina hoheduenensis]
MTTPLWQIDSFAEEPFTGNPAAVALLPHAASDSWMRRVAAEMNLSEAAFVVAEGNRYRLRWFTPTVEVDLCGHATLAAAHALWESGVCKAGLPIEFATRSGPLIATQTDGKIVLNLPATVSTPTHAPATVLKALGVHPISTRHFTQGLMLELATEEEIRSAAPDYLRLAEAEEDDFIITARSRDPRYDFVSRFFAPAHGINEDPVTGWAHCCLGPYWATKLGKNELTGRQLSNRGGTVGVRVLGKDPASDQPDGDRVELAGKAITVLRGELVTPVDPS